MQTFLTILITVLMFGVLILIHELGHFLTARWAKVKINEFAIGMGPTVFKKQGKETIYSIRAFPIGGFVQMDGEDGNGTDENSFNNKPKWKRFLILVAGAFNNLVFGFLLICLVYGVLANWSAFPTTTVGEFHEDAVSSACGLEVNDRIYSIDGYRIYTYNDIGYACNRGGIKPLTVEVLRDGEKVTLENVRFNVESTDYAGDFFSVDFAVYPSRKTIWSTVKYSFNSTISLSRSIYSFLGSLITGNADIKNVSGPIGTTKVISETVVAETGIHFPSLILMTAMISLNLGIVNLLPFPALDGGRIVVLAYEAIFRKKMGEKLEVAINVIGFAILMVLMILICIKDIISLL